MNPLPILKDPRPHCGSLEVDKYFLSRITAQVTT